jgi:DNA repair photolyase
VCAEYRNPVAIVTKGALIERDLDVLVRLSEVARVTVSLSIPLWNEEAARALEPFVPTPSRRMLVVRRLAEAGLDVGVSVAPFIVGLSEDSMVELLTAARRAGASRAVLSFLRLPAPVDAVFAERLRRSLPLRAESILKRAEDASYAKVVAALFESTCRRLSLPCSPADDDRANTPNAGPPESRTFRRPPRMGDQLRLF